MSGTIAIVLNKTDCNAKCIAVVRKATDLSIGDIRQRSLCGAPVFECSYIDEEGISKAIGLCHSLKEAGVEPAVFEHERPCTVDFLEGLIGFYEEIN